MRIICYDRTEEFLVENEGQLCEREAVNNLILKNAYIHKKEKARNELLFGKVVDEDDRTQLLFCNVHPFNLIFNSTERYGSRDSIEFLAEYIVHNNIPIKGINSNAGNCKAFINRYKPEAGMKLNTRLKLDLMELRKLNDIKLPKGQWRFADSGDEELVADWAEKFRIEATHEINNDRDFIRQDMKERINKRVIFLYENEDKKVVSMAIVSSRLNNGISISYVYTDINERNKGYGRAVVYNLCKYNLEEGCKFCCLFVDQGNPISNRVYADIGFKKLEDNFDYRLEKALV